jgi:hypothetical protein
MNFWDITSWLDTFQVWIGIGTLLAAAGLFIMNLKRKRHNKKLRNKYENVTSIPAIVIIDIGKDKNSDTQVRNYARNDVTLSNIGKNDIFTVSIDNQVNRADMDEIFDKIQNLKLEISRGEYNEIHLFCACPMVCAEIAGAIFSNGTITYGYQYLNSTYENWGPLHLK